MSKEKGGCGECPYTEKDCYTLRKMDGVCAYDGIFTEIEFAKCKFRLAPTNADRIRAMTDEELAKFLLEFEYHESNLYCMKLNSCTWDDPCADCLREWLKKEVE